MIKKIIFLLFLFCIISENNIFASSITDISTANIRMASPTFNFNQSVIFATSNYGLNVFKYKYESYLTHNFMIIGYPISSFGTSTTPDVNTSGLYFYDPGSNRFTIFGDNNPGLGYEYGIEGINPQNGSTGFLFETVGINPSIHPAANGRVIINSYTNNGISFNLDHDLIPTTNPNFIWTDWNIYTGDGTLMKLDLTGNLWVKNKIEVPICSANIIINTNSNIQSLLASSNINPIATYIPVVGNGGAVTVTANPQITTTNIEKGTCIEIWGTNNTNTVTLQNGNGLKLNGGINFTLGLDDIISFRYNGTSWCERFRSNN